MSRTLDDLAMRCWTDKRRGGDGHGYIRYYEQYLSHLRSEPLKIFEIGFARGRSHMMWARYFNRAKIYAIDNVRTAEAYLRDSKEQWLDRIHLELIDQGDSNKLEEFAKKHGPFDVVIDDGSHIPNHQISCFNILMPYTRLYYFVEDMHPGYQVGRHNTIEFFRDIVDALNYHGKLRHYDKEFTPKSNTIADYIEWVQFVPNAVIIKRWK